MTYLVDSHAHLSLEDFDHDRDEVIQKSLKAGILAILCPGEVTDPKNLRITLEVATKYSSILAAAGVHPHHAKDFTQESAHKIESLAQKKQIRAIGEIGLDFHYNFSSPEQQIAAFRAQLNLAQQLNLPVIIHSRTAADTVAQCIDEEGFTQGGILHCFTESFEFAQDMLACAFYISFSGIITFPKAHLLREVAKKLPLDRLLIETDSPYLAPVPYRGRVKRNEPVYVKETALNLAGLKGVPIEQLAEATTKNFENCFQIELKNL
jgi:TatD DNase family protein